jgi:hypothetical protein
VLTDSSKKQRKIALIAICDAICVFKMHFVMENNIKWHGENNFKFEGGTRITAAAVLYRHLMACASVVSIYADQCV